MDYIIVKSKKSGEVAFFIFSKNAYIDDSIINAKIISKGYCEINTVGEINCYVDSSLEFKREDDSRLIESINND